MMNKIRRTLCQSVGGFLGLLSLGACSQPAPQKPQQVYTEEEQRYVPKFRGIGGGNFFVSSMHELRWIEVSNQDGRYIDAPSLLVAGSPISGSGMPFVLAPIRIRVTWREQDANNPIHSGNRNEAWSGGKITGNFEIPVAKRIPDDLLDDLRRDPSGNLRIKIRLHREGVLLGWDIERRPGYDPKKRDKWGNPIYVDSVYSFFGGDFREAEIFNGKAVRKGWYIHPRTNARIETDY